MGLKFAEVADRFRMIDDRKRAVLVPFGDGARLIEQLAKGREWTRALARRLQGFQVGLYEREFEHARRIGAIYRVAPALDVWACTETSYDRELGFRPTEQVFVV